jgi:hypothetical protein
VTRVVHGRDDLALELHLAFWHAGLLVDDLLVRFGRGRGELG